MGVYACDAEDTGSSYKGPDGLLREGDSFGVKLLNLALGGYLVISNTGPYNGKPPG